MSGCGGDGGSGDSIEEGTTSYNSSQEEAEGNTSSGRNRDKSRLPKKRHQSRPVSSRPVNLKRTTAGSHSISQTIEESYQLAN